MTDPTQFLSRTGYREVKAAAATTLTPGANINGVLFTGAVGITVTADAGTLTGAALAANVLNSSLTSVGTLAGLTVTNPISGSITGSAPAGSLTGDTLNATVVNSSLTSVGTLTTLAVSGTATFGSVGTTGGVQYILPTTDGTPGQQLTTDGAGNLYWS